MQKCAYAMTHERCNSPDSLIAFEIGRVFHHFTGVPECLVMMGQSQRVVLRRVEPILFLEHKILRVRENIVECRRATQSNRIPTAPQLARVIGVWTENYTWSGKRLIVSDKAPTVC